MAMNSGNEKLLPVIVALEKTHDKYHVDQSDDLLTVHHHHNFYFFSTVTLKL